MVKDASSRRAKLRLQAEQRVREAKAEAAPPGTEQNTLRLLHELQVHQVELELQNEELGASRTLAETALARYTDLYDFAPVGYFTLTREGHIVEANLTGASLVGMPHAGLLRCGLGRFVAREELARWDQHLMSVLRSSERQTCELPLRREDGSTFYARLDSIRLGLPSQQDQSGGRLPAMRVAMSDITERQQVERRRQLLAEILGNLNQAVPFGEAINLILAAIERETGLDGVGIRLRGDDDFTHVAQSGLSPGALGLERTCGLVLSGKTDPTDPQCTPVGSFWTNDAVPFPSLPPDQDPGLRPRRRCIHEGFRSVALIPIRASREIVGLLQLSDRRKGRFTPAAIGFFEELSASIGVALVRKRMEDALRKVADELERSNRDLEQFATVASHDLQEPLRAVASYSQLLQKRCDGRLDEQAARFLQGAIDGADRMQRLIDDLLAFSRVGSQGAAPRIVAADAAVVEALANLKTAVDESGAVVACGPLPQVRADDRQLAQLLQNLIGNALKFRSDRTPRIDIAAVRQGGHWLFSVRDNGIGIDAPHQGRIFEIFQRLHSRAKFPGTGVGLAICKRIVERHGGTIRVESEPDRGSTFFFTLPDGT